MTDQYIARTDDDVARVAAAIRMALVNGPVMIKWASYKAKRRDAQNRLLWRWMSEIQSHMAACTGQTASAEDWHDTLCRKLRPVQGVTLRLPGGENYATDRWRSSKAGVAEMAEYLTDLDAYCAESLGLLLSHGTDEYHEAMSKRR